MFTRPYRRPSLSLLVVILVFSIAPAARYQRNAKRLFDGKSFKGWEGDLNIFRIEGGAIVGGTLKAPIARNEFLCTAEEFGDFELRLKFKLLGDPARANAGIQFRSQRIPNDHEVIGYQADMGQQYWGSLYDESRRRKTLAGPNLDELNKVLKREDWNDYVIRAEGKRVRLSINGFQTVDYTEPDDAIAQRGRICVQIHGGPPSEAWYKDISIETLKK
jgi:3-keto-disaccharide hydrolase